MEATSMAKKPGKKSKAKPKKMTAKEQSARFIEMAKEVEASESSEVFEMVFEKLVPAKKKSST